jgi:hypothetical protein
MVTPALITAILAAVLVHLRHRELVVAVQHDPTCEPMRRRQLMFETWVLTGPSLALLVASSLQP